MGLSDSVRLNESEFFAQQGDLLELEFAHAHPSLARTRFPEDAEDELATPVLCEEPRDDLAAPALFQKAALKDDMPEVER